MAAGDGFDEQVFVDAINATREEWLAEAINFIATLESISTSQLTLDLPNTLMPIGGLGTIYDDFRTRVTGEPVKPTGLDYVSPTDPGPVPPVDVGDIETVNVPTLGASPPAMMRQILFCLMHLLLRQLNFQLHRRYSYLLLVSRFR
jgi:hypothetical protein